MSHEAAYALINAQSRLATLRGFDIMDSAPEAAFDDIVALAARFCETPVATIALIDSHRQWFKACKGFDYSEAPLVESVCAETLDVPGLLIINDLSADRRTRDNKAVLRENGLRFYARCRLETERGDVLGTLCVIDFTPRPEGLRADQVETLLALGRQVMAALELRRVLAERIRQEAAHGESRARLRAIFESSYQFQGFLAPDGTLLDANVHALAMIGRALADVVGTRLWDTPWFAATPDMPRTIEAAVRRAGAGESVRQEVRLDLPAGPRILDFALRPIVDDRGIVLGIVPEAIDMTDFRRVESELRQAQKLEAIGQLTGGIAHDFNNMLGAVIGFLGLARRRLDGHVDANVAAYLDHAEAGAGRAVALTKRLLGFARRDILDPRPLDAGRLVEDMADFLRHSLSQLVRLDVSRVPDGWGVLADRAQLESALLNLCINACDAMPEGGLLQIRIANVCLAAPEAGAVGILGCGDHVLIEVEDTGVGMDARVLEHAFEPFFTTKGVGRGTGLGLSQVLGFMMDSGGHVKVDSHAGRGTAIRLFFPRHATTAASLSMVREPATCAGASLPGICVLVVDDEERVRAMSAASLAELGCRVKVAASPEDALLQITRDGDIDLLFTDVVMPGLTGPQLADRARHIRPALKIVFTTGCQQRSGLHCATPPDALILMKPYTPEALAAMMQAACSA